jgi:PIN domain nuclease of toxin-antitoxin system
VGRRDRLTVLLDTHTLLWWLLGSRQLSDEARDLIADADTDVVVSAVSALEIATKHRLGKLFTGSVDPSALAGVLRQQRMRELPITVEYTLAAGALPGPLRDPFDRLLIAQSRAEGLPVITMDPVFSEYGVPVIW